ncbi:MAG: hypothetical protein HW421_1322 [Ignavibacteria bacterium]|nr:hypothetical protein [Ignavibacteria bacterium]
MRNILIFLSLILFSACGAKQDPKEIIISSYQKRLNILSAQFNVSEVSISSSGVKKLTEYKVWLKRNENDNAIHAKIRLEDSEGNIITYNGRTYAMLMPKNKSVFIVEKIFQSSEFIKKYINIIKAVIRTTDKKYEDNINKDSSFVYQGSANSDGVKCLLVKSEAPLDNEDIGPNSNHISINYYGCEDGVIRKFENVLLVNNIKIEEEKYILKNVQLNVLIPDSLFKPRPPADYEVEYFRPEKQDEADDSEESHTLQEGDTAPDFTLKDSKGNEVKLSSFLGKVIVLDFWGTWCPWCVVAIPKIQAIYDKFKGKPFELYGVSCRETNEADPAGFIREKGFSYKTLIHGDDVAKDYGVTGYPTLFIIGKDGKILFVHPGYSKDMEKELSDVIEKELEKPA